MADARAALTERSTAEFGGLLRYTAMGYLGGLALGLLLDLLGLSQSGAGQWAVRTLAGEGESLLEGLYALRRRLAGAAGSLAEAYGWGKLAGLAVPWAIDGASRLAGVDVYAPEGFYIPFFYAMSDQIGANLAGLAFLIRRSPTAAIGARLYLTHPVMVAGLLVIAAVPAGLFVARVAGFSPGSQVLTALETIVANLCWLPPLVGWLGERRARGRA